MNVKRFRLVLMTVALMSMIATYTVSAWQQDSINQSTDQSTQVRPIETARESMIKSQLGSLLRNVGVQVGERLPETSDHKRMNVRWQSSTTGAKLLESQQQQEPGILTFTDSAPRDGAVPRPRTVELTTTQMLVIAVDEQQKLQWWNQFPDPRIIRAEVPDANGQQHIGRTFYLTQTDFTVAYPNNPAIQEIRFYHPAWTGSEFLLELIGSVSVK